MENHSTPLARSLGLFLIAHGHHKVTVLVEEVNLVAVGNEIRRLGKAFQECGFNAHFVRRAKTLGGTEFGEINLRTVQLNLTGQKIASAGTGDVVIGVEGDGRSDGGNGAVIPNQRTASQLRRLRGEARASGKHGDQRGSSQKFDVHGTDPFGK